MAQARCGRAQSRRRAGSKRERRVTPSAYECGGPRVLQKDGGRTLDGDGVGMDVVTQTIESLTNEFGMPGVLEFGRRGELVCLEVRTPAVTAAVALQGAHLLEWKPAGEAAVLFLSKRTEFAEGKAIRGGVPVIWPWFGARSEAVLAAPAGAPKSPSHGFARTAVWRLQFAAVMADEVHLTFSLAPNAESRAQGFDGFRLVYGMVLGRELTLRLTVANDGEGELRFEEALHSYFAVGEIERVRLSGTEGTEYLDKPDGMKRKRQAEAPLAFTEVTDRVYLATEATCRVDDAAGERVLQVAKQNSQNTVVWNPWAELTAGLADMEPAGWHAMLCVETANVGEAAIALAPGATHTMEARVTVDRSAAAGNAGGDGSIPA